MNHPCRRVLVVEDDEDLLQAIAEYLEMEEIEPVLARKGSEALEALAHGPIPDVVLLDIGMPGMSGAEVLERMRETAAWSSIPVAVMSGFRRDQFAYLPAPDDFLEKPFDLERLNGALSSLCRRRHEASRAAGEVATG